MSFVFNATATTESYTYGHTLSLHDALPISARRGRGRAPSPPPAWRRVRAGRHGHIPPHSPAAESRRAPAPEWRRSARPEHRRAARSKCHWGRSEEHTSELQSLMRISYAVFCLNKKTKNKTSQHLISYTINIYT